MVAAAEYARRTGTPYFGICYGFQWAVTEYARNVCGLAGANSTEVDDDAEHKIIYKLQDLLGVEEMGGTMRLGSYPCQLAPGSRAAQIYGATRGPRAPPPSLRVQQGIRELPHPGRTATSAARRPTASSWRSPRSRATPGTWPCSSTPSSSPSRWRRTRSSPTSCGRASSNRPAPRRQAAARPRPGGPRSGRRAAWAGPPRRRAAPSS